MNKQNLKSKIKKLIQAFQDQDGWNKGEDDIQLSFTIELLRILGWDSSGWTVNTHQEIKTGERPDIILKNEGSKLLVIESKDAKKKDKLDGRYQSKRFDEQLFGYCDAEGLNWGVLTNFVEWRIYSVHHERIYKKKYAFHDILWPDASKDNYVDLLSNEGLEFLNLLSKKYLTDKNGRIDDANIYYPQQEDIKKDFFEKIKVWRANLKSFVAKNYASYSDEKVDLISQKILDRMIFMDICYDKEAINQNHIKSVLKSKHSKYEELKAKFRLMDDKFNTELFAENECDEIKVSDEIIVPIIEQLEKIDFKKLSVHVIGEVYENYLGELAKSNVKKEETKKAKQKQKRKSQGIYYTPDYIVDYIVKNTVGEILKNCKTEKEIEKIRVLDPACGSGSFLIRAFDEFYDAYQRVHRRQEGFIFEVKKKILQKNLFGVDLDPKAVEITKLNLMIKALEGVKPKHLQGKHLLPNLNLNIRCGNSLIGGEVIADKQEKVSLWDTYESEIDALSKLKDDFYHAFTNQDKKALLKKIEEKEEFIDNNHTFGLNRKLKTYFRNLEKIKPFNYSVAFAEVMRDGGFDAVVGNPPYVQLSAEASKDKGLKNYLIDNFHSSMGRLNTFGYFVKLGTNILKRKGKLGYIIPNTILTQESYEELREMILEECAINKIVSFDSLPFKQAVVENIIIILERENNYTKRLDNHIDIVGVFEDMKFKTINNIEQKAFSMSNKSTFNIHLDTRNILIKKKLFQNTDALSTFLDINQAIALKYDRSKFIFNKNPDNKFKPLLDGREIDRYYTNWADKYLKYDVNAIHSCKREDIFLSKEKLFFRRVGSGLVATYDDKQFYALNTLVVMNRKPSTKYDIKYFLALFNSRLLNYYYSSFLKSTKKVFSEIQARQVSQLPIKIVDSSEEKNIYNQIIKLVDEMLKLNKASESREKNQNKIKALDYEIDQLVYKLYGLTNEEIKMVEGER